MIAIVDFGSGNLRSVFNAVHYLGEKPELISDPERLSCADRIIFPGVGSFGNCMEGLRSSGMAEALEDEVIQRGKPFLGICLGFQVLASHSEESPDVAGLGWLKAEIKCFNFQPGCDLRVPHVGWNDVVFNNHNPIFKGIEKCASFYFVHSYYMTTDDESNIAATCNYGGDFTAVISKDNIFATQFHPEKSQNNGIQLLENFLFSNALIKC